MNFDSRYADSHVPAEERALLDAYLNTDDEADAEAKLEAYLDAADKRTEGAFTEGRQAHKLMVADVKAFTTAHPTNKYGTANPYAGTDPDRAQSWRRGFRLQTLMDYVAAHPDHRVENWGKVDDELDRIYDPINYPDGVPMFEGDDDVAPNRLRP